MKSDFLIIVIVPPSSKIDSSVCNGTEMHWSLLKLHVNVLSKLVTILIHIRLFCHARPPLQPDMQIHTYIGGLFSLRSVVGEHQGCDP